jgi:hypothetical protein
MFNGVFENTITILESPAYRAILRRRAAMASSSNASMPDGGIGDAGATAPDSAFQP